jgi:Holliday junction resolvase
MGKTSYENGVSFRKPRNSAEAACFDAMREAGWTVTKRGWPDFFCVKDGEICVVEVKPRGSTPMKKNQNLVMEKLKEHGITCYRYDPDDGLTKV